jgi:hypothetical protein
MKNNLSLAKYGDKLDNYRRSLTLADTTSDIIEGIFDMGLCTAIPPGEQRNLCLIDAAIKNCEKIGISEEDCDTSKQIVEAYKTFNEGAKSAEEIVADVKKSEQDKQFQIADDILNQFYALSCSDLTDEQKKDLAERLKAAENTFREFSMLERMNEIYNKLKCDGKISCKTENAVEICEFKPKKNLLKNWGVPVGVGGATGLAMWKVTTKKTLGLVGGAIGFAVTKYVVS